MFILFIHLCKYKFQINFFCHCKPDISDEKLLFWYFWFNYVSQFKCKQVMIKQLVKFDDKLTSQWDSRYTSVKSIFFCTFKYKIGVSKYISNQIFFQQTEHILNFITFFFRVNFTYKYLIDVIFHKTIIYLLIKFRISHC